MKNLLKKIYRQLPFKKSFFEVIKIIASPSEDIYKHLHFQDDFRVVIDKTHSFLVTHYGFEVENPLFSEGVTGNWEKTSLSLWIKLVATAEFIIDVGANTGVYSLIAKSLNPKAQVYAFDPVERVFQKLKHNTQLNNYDIDCNQMALSNTDGTATIYDTPTEHTYSATVNKDMNVAGTETVPTKIKIGRLNTFVKENHIEKIDLMKIDVETHEAEVLERLGDLLEKFRPPMLIEILNDEVGGKVENLIKNKDYLYFNLDEKTHSIKRIGGITKSAHWNFLLCNAQIAEKLGLLN